MENKSIYCTLTDHELAAKADQWIDELIASGGKSWRMCVPARPNEDSDLIFAELNNRFKGLLKAHPLTPGAPTTTGTYFAVMKPYVGDRDEMVVIHYQADKGVYYAYGVMSRPVKAEDVIGYIPREAHVPASATVTIKMVNMNEVEKLKEEYLDLGRRFNTAQETMRDQTKKYQDLQQLAIDNQTKGDRLVSALRSLRLSVTAHPDYTGEDNAEWTDLVNASDEAILNWLEKKEDKEHWSRCLPNGEKGGLEWLHNPIIEFCYRHTDGRVEVRYRRIEGTEECNAMIAEVDGLIEKAKPEVSPYFYRKEVKPHT
jgi:hypothetical protein